MIVILTTLAALECEDNYPYKWEDSESKELAKRLNGPTLIEAWTIEALSPMLSRINRMNQLIFITFAAGMNCRATWHHALLPLVRQKGLISPSLRRLILK